MKFLDERHPVVAEEPLLATAREFDLLKESLPWQDIRNFLLERIELVRDDLEKADTLEQVKYFQGELQTLRHMLYVPDYLKTQANQEENDG